jgi:hypothetical protein
MSKIGCNCGATIHDTTYPLPNKGQIIRDQQYDLLTDRMAEDISQFIEAKLNGRQYEWVKQRFTEDYANLNLKDEAIANDLITGYLVKNCLNIYQCETCGRVLIESKSDKNKFYSFQPDSEDSKDLFIKEEEDSNATNGPA